MSYVDEIAGLVSEAAAVVWELMVKQVQVENVGYGLLAIGGLAAIGFGTYSIKLKRDSGEWSMWELGIIFGYLLGLPIFLGGMYAVIARLINPAWYAVKILLSGLQ